MEKTNKNLVELVKEIRKYAGSENSKFWKRIVKELEKPTRQMRAVNIAKINQYCNDGEIAVIPGKVLGNGELTKKVKVAALKFSEVAAEKIKDKMTIKELLDKKLDTKNMRIMG